MSQTQSPIYGAGQINVAFSIATEDASRRRIKGLSITNGFGGSAVSGVFDIQNEHVLFTIHKKNAGFGHGEVLSSLNGLFDDVFSLPNKTDAQKMALAGAEIKFAGISVGAFPQSEFQNGRSLIGGSIFGISNLPVGSNVSMGQRVMMRVPHPNTKGNSTTNPSQILPEIVPVLENTHAANAAEFIRACTKDPAYMRGLSEKRNETQLEQAINTFHLAQLSYGIQFVAHLIRTGHIQPTAAFASTYLGKDPYGQITREAYNNLAPTFGAAVTSGVAAVAGLGSNAGNRIAGIDSRTAGPLGWKMFANTSAEPQGRFDIASQVVGEKLAELLAMNDYIPNPRALNGDGLALRASLLQALNYDGSNGVFRFGYSSIAAARNTNAFKNNSGNEVNPATIAGQLIQKQVNATPDIVGAVFTLLEQGRSNEIGTAYSNAPAKTKATILISPHYH